MSFPGNIPPGFHQQFAAWLRLEPRCRSNDFSRGIEARTADPLWLLTRQWQTGEFQGEDAGSPLEVSLNYSTQSIDSIRLGEAGDVEPLPDLPLEALVEQEQWNMDWRSRVQIGQAFERCIRKLDGMSTEDIGRIIRNYRVTYPLQAPTDQERVDIDNSTQRFIDFMVGRVIDGRKLLRQIGKNDLIQSEGLSIDQFNALKTTFDYWCSKIHMQPDTFTSPAWRPQQLHYQFELNPPPPPGPEEGDAGSESDTEAQTPVTQKTRLIARDYRSGDLDWYTFSTTGETQESEEQEIWESPEQFLPLRWKPSRLSVAGTSPRWWAFEDAATNFGAMDVAKPDLAKLALMEFVLIYGDDWFTFPLQVDMPKLVRIDDLWVVDVFNKKTPIPSVRCKTIEEGHDPWQVFTIHKEPNETEDGDYDAGDCALDDILFIPQVTGFRRESKPQEEVRFIRDEGANMVWGIEHTILSGRGRPVRGFEAQRERIERRIIELENRLKAIEQALSTDELTDLEIQELENEANEKQAEMRQLTQEAKPVTGGIPQYRLATRVPENWIPFLPFNAQQFMDYGHSSIRLRRAAMLSNTNQPEQIPAMSRILDISRDPMWWLEESAVSRAGSNVQLTNQWMRWVDGKTYVWLGRKVKIGKGEGSIELRWDCLI